MSSDIMMETPLVCQDWRLRRRILEYIDKVGRCWLWVGCTDSGGYGRVRIDDEVHLVHRLAYKLWREDPGERVLRRTCSNAECCNPWHWWMAP